MALVPTTNLYQVYLEKLKKKKKEIVESGKGVQNYILERR